MPDRFYVPEEWSETMELAGTEAHHLIRVLRAAPGNNIEIFNGRGHASDAVVESVGKQAVTLRLVPPMKTTPAPDCEIVLAVAAPKGDRWSWMIEKVTELGVDRLIPLSTARSVVKPGNQKLLKAEQTVIAACKQSGRNRVLAIEPLCPLQDLRQRVDLETTRLLVGDHSAVVDTTDFGKWCYHSRAVLAVVGPEGGLTAQERDLLTEWGARPISLSSYVLRVETAALAYAAWLCAGRQHLPAVF